MWERRSRAQQRGQRGLEEGKSVKEGAGLQLQHLDFQTAFMFLLWASSGSTIHE
jgi:hypothetical protein